MYKYIQGWPRHIKAVVIFISYFFSLLAFSLVISAVADDGANKFAKLFTYIQKEEIKNDTFYKLIEVLKNVAPKDLNNLSPAEWLKQNSITPSFIYEYESQNFIGLIFFICFMGSLIFIGVSIATSIIFITYKGLQQQVRLAHTENLINTPDFHTITDILEKAQKENKKHIFNKALKKIQNKQEQEKELLELIEKQHQEQGANNTNA